MVKELFLIVPYTCRIIGSCLDSEVQTLIQWWLAKKKTHCHLEILSSIICSLWNTQWHEAPKRHPASFLHPIISSQPTTCTLRWSTKNILYTGKWDFLKRKKCSSAASPKGVGQTYWWSHTIYFSTISNVSDCAICNQTWAWEARLQ